MFLESHEEGDIRGTYGLALAWFEGIGTTKDRALAEALTAPIIPIIERRASEGSTEHLVILGDLYSFGLGKQPDHHRAFQLYSLAAAAGNLEAQCNLGYAYLVGQGVEPDLEMTLFWWLASAEAGYAHSCRDIGECYLYGNGVQVDYGRAVHWFQRASDANYSHGTTDLAHCFLHGFGVERDVERAAGLYRLALAQDFDRTHRDLLAANIDVDTFLAEGRVVVVDLREVTEVPAAEVRNGRYFVRPSVERLDPGAFTSCGTVFKFLADGRNKHFRAVDGVLYSRDRRQLVRYPNGSEVEHYTCAPFVERIGPKAFQNARRLLSVAFNEGLLEIGDSALDDCKSLTQVTFRGALVSIGPWAFHGCDALTSVRVPASVGSIGEYAFGSCEALVKIEVDPSNVAYASVDGCLYDREVTRLLQYPIGVRTRCYELPRSVESLAFRSFSDAYHLEEVFLGERVTELGEKAFYLATSLQRVHFRGPPPRRMGERVFDRTHEHLTVLVPALHLSQFQRDERFARLRIIAEV